MIKLRFSAPQFRIKKEEEKHFVFDEIRKTWIVLTEEEWVRQLLVQHLVTELQYPASLIALEKEIWLGDVKKRFDILVYDRQHQPWMMIECKAPQVALSEAVLQQLMRYSITVPVPYLIISNGEHTIGWEKKEGQLHLINELPAFQSGI